MKTGFGVLVPLDGHMDGPTAIIVLLVIVAVSIGIIAQIASSIGGSKPPLTVEEMPTYDIVRWNALVQYDADIKRIVDALAPFGQKYIDEFAQAFMALNDKSYLPQIIEKILATAKADAARVVIEEGEFNNIYWRKHSDGSLEGRLDKKWTAISSIDELRTYSPSRGV
jgi:hypothetical protein